MSLYKIELLNLIEKIWHRTPFTLSQSRKACNYIFYILRKNNYKLSGIYIAEDGDLFYCGVTIQKQNEYQKFELTIASYILVYPLGRSKNVEVYKPLVKLIEYLRIKMDSIDDQILENFLYEFI